MKKKKHERKIITDEEYCNVSWELKEGWEVEKTEVIKKEDKYLFYRKDRIVKAYHLKRDITPTKIKLNLTITLPKWRKLK